MLAPDPQARLTRQKDLAGILRANDDRLVAGALAGDDKLEITPLAIGEDDAVSRTDPLQRLSILGLVADIMILGMRRHRRGERQR